MTITTIKLKTFENKLNSDSSKHSHIQSNHTILPKDLTQRAPKKFAPKLVGLVQERAGIAEPLQKHITANLQFSPIQQTLIQQKPMQQPARNTIGDTTTSFKQNIYIKGGVLQLSHGKSSRSKVTLNKSNHRTLKSESEKFGKTVSGLARRPARSGSPNHFCLITIKRTKNNTHATISNLIGDIKTKCHISAGQLKLPGGRRKTRLSQRLIYKSCLEKAQSFGYKYTVIHCKGNRGSKVRIFRDFGNSLTVLLIKDTTGAAHNGCRPRKVRRV